MENVEKEFRPICNICGAELDLIKIITPTEEAKFWRLNCNCIMEDEYLEDDDYKLY